MVSNSTKTAINSIYPDCNELIDNPNPSRNAVRAKHYLNHNARQIAISAHTHATALISVQGAELMMIETDSDIMECQCSMHTRGLIETLPQKLSYLYIANWRQTMWIHRNLWTAPLSPTFHLHCTRLPWWDVEVGDKAGEYDAEEQKQHENWTNAVHNELLEHWDREVILTNSVQNSD